jgi:hypothetical protein
MKINLHIEYAGGVSREVVANAADMVAFESKFDVSVAALGNEPKLSYLYFLAYASEKRTAQTTATFEKWLETVEMVGTSDTDPKSKG